MKISLKNTKTGKYLAQPGEWTENPAAAKAFPDEESAREYFTFRKLAAVVVVKLAEPGGVEPAPIERTARQTTPILVAEQTIKSDSEPSTIRPPRPTRAMPVEQEPTEAKAPLSQNRFVTKPAVVEAKVDVGFGNVVFIRGQGAGLSWEKGQALNCEDGTTWVWSSEETNEKAVFKLLLNDQVWAQGGDLVLEPGKTVSVAPAF